MDELFWAAPERQPTQFRKTEAFFALGLLYVQTRELRVNGLPNDEREVLKMLRQIATTPSLREQMSLELEQNAEGGLHVKIYSQAQSPMILANLQAFIRNHTR